MRRRSASGTLLVLGVLALVVGGAVWLATRGEDRPPADATLAEADRASREPSLLAPHAPADSLPLAPTERTALPDVVEPTAAVSTAPGPEAIVGVLLDTSGQPVPGRVVVPACCWIGDAPTLPVPMPRGPLDSKPHRTDSEGRFRFEPMPRTGTYLRVADDPRDVAGPVAATPGVPVTLRLRPRPWVTITVVDSHGIPVPELGVVTSIPADGGDGETARDVGVQPGELGRLAFLFEEPQSLARGRWNVTPYSSGTTDAKGRVRLAPILREHPCWLGIYPVRGRNDDSFPLSIKQWTPKDETITLRAAKSIEGVARDLRAEPLTEGQIRWQGADGASGSSRVEYDGTFLLSRVPDGPVTLEVEIPGTPLPPRAGHKSVAAGDANVALVVDLGTDLLVEVEGWPRVPDGVVLATLEATAREGVAERARAEIDPDGRARLRGLRSDAAYTLFVAPTADELRNGGAARYAMREHVRATGAPVRMTLAEGATIGGTAPVPRELSGGGVRSLAAIDDAGVVLRVPVIEGRFELRGVPPGRHRVRVFAYASWFGPGSPVFVGESVEKAGTSDALLTLHPAPDGTKAFDLEKGDPNWR